MTLTEINRTLREIRVTPVKTLGQSFLHDQNLARWAVEKAELTPDDVVVEIGPGLGALTEFAVNSGARVIAIEKDARLANFLRERFAGAKCEILHLDGLRFDLRPLFAQRSTKLIGNLPYYVASELMMKFIAYPSPFSLVILMLQKEMARRISASPRTSEYGAMSLMVQEHYRVEYLRSVPATAFVPQPDVDSAFVRLVPRAVDELPQHDPATFKRVVRLGFSQRRKQLQKLLRAETPDWAEAAAAGGFTPKARAEELSLEQWIGLSNLASGTQPTAKSTDSELLAVVDAEDRIVGSATRREIHGNKSLHRAVHILVFNRDGELFLQKRSRWKDRHPLLWDSSAAGHVDAGEEYEAAAVREVQEELGVSPTLMPVAKIAASEGTGHEFIKIYRAEHDGPFSLPPVEIEHGEFFPRAVVNAWVATRPSDFAPGFVECWRVFSASAEA
ncbi:MAG: 16S rRNA (adenine(1518)-N(6)/adenine(1519)-N(6))-dimethyltransferase RsmA [Chthoniobacterales bacterium]